MIGIILAGGSGSRLRPLTLGVSKQLQAVYNKPMIYYPLSTLMLAGIREIVVITTPSEGDSFKRLLGDGSHFGTIIHYEVQSEPLGLAQAFPISESHIRNKKTALILGDNVFHGRHIGSELSKFLKIDGAQIFGYRVANPSEYGVAEIDSKGKVLSLEEKPSNPKSNYAVPGLYFYDEKVLEISKSIQPSRRGELEITDVNRVYLSSGELYLEVIPRGTAWLDTGTFGSLHDASSYIKAVEDRQGLMISCIEEIAFRNGWIDMKQLEKRARELGEGPYANYLLSIREEN